MCAFDTLTRPVGRERDQVLLLSKWREPGSFFERGGMGLLSGD